MYPTTRLALVVSLAACTLTGCASDRVAALESENIELRRQLAEETARQMRDIGLYAAIYAQSNNDMFPTRPSELRATLDRHGEDWTIFLAPYDRPMNKLSAVQGMEDPWAWIDANTSFVFSNAKLGDPNGVFLTERAPVMREIRYTLFADTHVEAVKLSSGS